MPKAIIIGSGLAGIASAIRMAVDGYDVEVFEANPYPGGKLAEINLNGYRFDAGPSLFTMPQYVDELFELAGKNPRNYFNYQKLDPVCRYFYQDGTTLNAWADTGSLAEEFANKTADDATTIKKFLEKSARIYAITNHIFLEKSLHKIASYLTLQTLGSVFRFASIDAFRTMDKANQSYFKDEKTIRFFNRYATYNGSDPYQAPATLNVIPHLEQHFGAYFPANGMYSITTSLVKLAEELGVKFNYNCCVEEILVDASRATGIKTPEENVPADVVISNMDIWFTYHKLLKEKVKPQQMLQQRSSSALIFYWGVKKKFPGLDLHNIFFSENYQEEFRYLWEEKSVYHDPTIYVNISSKYKPDDAPPGCENWFVMINVPSNSGQNWAALVDKAKQNILKRLSRHLNEDVAKLIECETVLDPRDLEQRTFSYQGSIYGTSSNSRYAAFMRHPNYSSRIKGLYFAGGSVHPGGGIPLALLSAKIATGLIQADR